MTLRRGTVTKVWQRLIEVKLKNPEQDIVNVVPVHALDTDERTETEYIKEGTEVLVMIDSHNVAYAIGATSEGYDSIVKKQLKRIENEEVQLNAKNIKLVGFDGKDTSDFVHTKAKKYELLNKQNDNLIDIISELSIAVIALGVSEGNAKAVAIGKKCKAKMKIFGAKKGSSAGCDASGYCGSCGTHTDDGKCCNCGEDAQAGTTCTNCGKNSNQCGTCEADTASPACSSCETAGAEITDSTCGAKSCGACGRGKCGACGDKVGDDGVCGAEKCGTCGEHAGTCGAGSCGSCGAKAGTKGAGKCGFCGEDADVDEDGKCKKCGEISGTCGGGSCGKGACGKGTPLTELKPNPHEF